MSGSSLAQVTLEPFREGIIFCLQLRDLDFPGSEYEPAVVDVNPAILNPLPHHLHERREHSLAGLFLLRFVHTIAESTQQNVRDGTEVRGAIGRVREA